MPTLHTKMRSDLALIPTLIIVVLLAAVDSSSACAVMPWVPQDAQQVLVETDSTARDPTPGRTNTDTTDRPAKADSSTRQPVKDRWDKASVISQFVGSIVIALIGLLLTWMIHTSRNRITQDIANAQIRSAEQLTNMNNLHAERLEQLSSKLDDLRSQDAFVRELYANGIRDYSGSQARALRQAYLLLFEPEVSEISSIPSNNDERLELAIRLIMKPLRENHGWLDEASQKKIYSLKNELHRYVGEPHDVLLGKRNFVFNELELARQFLKADKIACRLGLIAEHLTEVEANDRT